LFQTNLTKLNYSILPRRDYFQVESHLGDEENEEEQIEKEQKEEEEEMEADIYMSGNESEASNASNDSTGSAQSWVPTHKPARGRGGGASSNGESRRPLQTIVVPRLPIRTKTQTRE